MKQRSILKDMQHRENSRTALLQIRMRPDEVQALKMSAGDQSVSAVVRAALVETGRLPKEDEPMGNK